jgi:type I protein arginine methyltransferase
MIQDTIRTSTYASFILSNPEIFENAVVLDVGCGTGILSLIAASAGAAHVYAIDASEIAEKAERIVRENKMQDKIT